MFNQLVHKVKAICLTKQNIVATSFTLALLFYDLKGFLAEISSNLYVIFIFFILLIIGLFVHFLLTRKKINHSEKDKTTTIDNTVPKENIPPQNQTQTSSTNEPNYYFPLKNKPPKGNVDHSSTPHVLIKSKNFSALTKIIFALLFSLGLLLTASLFYIKNAGIYYVVIKKDLSNEQANEIKNEFNANIKNREEKLALKVIPQRGTKDKWELILMPGLLTKAKADKQLLKFKYSNKQFDPYIVGPQKRVNFFRKLNYLQKHLLID